MTEAPIFDRKLADIRTKSPNRTCIVDQYRAVAGKFVELWSEVDIRTEKSDWREDGMGSCGYINTNLFETWLDGVVTQEIEGLSDALNRDAPDTNHPACKYHREGKGCILKDLKNPRCIQHTSSNHREEIEQKFGINFLSFREPLRKIQMGGMHPETGNYDLHPEENDELVEATVRGTQEVVDYIKTFPILHPVATF